MTEAKWLACVNPVKMVEHMRDEATGRKLRLLTTGFIRLFPRYLDDVPARLLLDTFEEYADDRAAYDAVVACRGPIEHLAGPIIPSSPARVVCDMLLDLTRREQYAPNAFWLARLAASEVGRVVIYARSKPESNDDVMKRSIHRAAVVVSDIFGNPFRPVAFSPEWRTDTVVALARAMYESRDFGAMPILADALQDAGCNNEGILAHCRGAGPHVRGCWVVDQVLSKP